MTLHTIFNQARTSRHLTLAQVAGKRNVSALSRFETGQSHLDTIRTLALMDSLGLNFLDVHSEPGVMAPPWQGRYEAILDAVWHGHQQQAVQLVPAADEATTQQAQLARWLMLAASGQTLPPAARQQVASYLVEVADWAFLEYQLMQQVGDQLNADQLTQVVTALLAVAPASRLADPQYLYRLEAFQALLVGLRRGVLTKAPWWDEARRALKALAVNLSANMTVLWATATLDAGRAFSLGEQEKAAVMARLTEADLVGMTAQAAPWRR